MPLEKERNKEANVTTSESCTPYVIENKMSLMRTVGTRNGYTSIVDFLKKLATAV